MKTPLFSLIFFSVSICLNAQSGTLDSSFGKDGFVAGEMFGLVNSIVQQPDGKLLVAGGYYDFNATIIRLFPDGELDSSFGNNGAAATNPLGTAYDMTLSLNGRILIVGIYVDENDRTQSFVSRFTPNGKLDSSFGVNGMCILPLLHRYDFFSEIALNADGSIMVGGAGYNNPNTLDSQYTIVSHVSADGKFDYNFGNNGHVVNLSAIVMNDLAIQSDGKIVTAGYNLFSTDFVLSRYNTDGTLDNSFGNNGNVVTAGKGYDVPEKIIIESDGKFIVGGYSNGSKYYMAALRYNKDGSLDKSFGNKGEVYVDFGDSAGLAYDMVQQPDGKFILAGAVSDLTHTGRNFGLCRITNDGKLDSSFGVNGLQITPYADGGEAYCVALQKDNKIVLGGYYQGSESEPYLIARYNNPTTKQIVINKIKHYIQTHNNEDATNNKLASTSITIYPNPVKDILIITGFNSALNYDLVITNEQGNPVTKASINNISSYQFNIQNLTTGVYYLNVAASNKLIATLKFVKQ